ncbi:MAG: UDP-glucose--hexose-1-phosphate uridylyltransferase [Clostridia bacterium]
MAHNATSLIEGMLDFAQQRALIEPIDRAYTRNLLLDIMALDAPEPCEKVAVPDTLTTLLADLAQIAVEKHLVADTQDARERFGVRLAGAVTPAPAQVRAQFARRYQQDGPEAATDWFYQMCRACDYIRVDHIKKNVRFTADSPAGPLEITINLSKPEKDPRDIARALTAPKLSYPRCMLCVENPGYAGRDGFPARQNHRLIPVTLAGDPFYLQYSPYLYYEEHSIVLNQAHVPMRIDRSTFERLFDFVGQFPHYFLGSNADLPIVGGSILSHDHFQGGRHIFPMDRAGARIALGAPDQRIEACVVDWPMTCIRMTCACREALIDEGERMLGAWRGYSDAALGVLAQTDAPHNTITPIVRRDGDKWILHLVLRNNRTSDAHPLGIFHPHADLHHVKKENIGLIEVMGLFILPGRLLGELQQARAYLTGARPLADAPSPEDPLFKHYEWLREIAKTCGCALTDAQAQAALRSALAVKCARVLADAGVFKADAAGEAGLLRFLGTLGYARS